MEKINLKDLKYAGGDKEVDVNGQAGQDLFVIAMLEGKTNGQWLELGCGGPIEENNTLTLEKQFGWGGTSIDISGLDIMYSGMTMEQEWKKWRQSSKFLAMDANSYDFSISGPRIDYLQIDLDHPKTAMDVLYKFTQHSRFSVLTFEHDYWVHKAVALGKKNHKGAITRYLTRKHLKSLGYVLLAADVVIEPGPTALKNDTLPIYFEDWWVDPTVVPANIIETYCSSKSFVPDKYWKKILLK